MTTDLFDLTGRTAVVTGARRGIGFAMAEALAAAGADIIAASSSQEADGGEIGRRVRDLGRSFEGHAVDFRDRDAVVAFGDAVAGRADILVNNAGTIRRAPAAEHPLEWWDEVIDVNLSSQFALSQKVGAAMLERGGGKIIFTASLLTFQGGINVPGYTSSKSAIGGLTKALANEWAGRGVNVNAIAPGYIATDNTQALREDADRSRSILERIPAGRWGQASDLGGAAVFLASRASDYVSGVTIPVDGGWMGR
ncbi:SDR family oxidoreductase [Microbacterium sp. G2-8]|uniref:SDR family oxidoreductase n=1 Tax=Microbacterium sp. G2-8 TaxID=2842454 RepID=UPI001C8AA87D|nr:SDR family oxidoreductase [Microbacterium sp. G2-8]